jgi:putative hydrolase of HD superfamily
MEKRDSINLQELMTGILTRTRYVHRWSTFHTLHKESVAEHSFFVAFYVLVIGNWVNKNGSRVNTKQALERALVHDLDEAYSGDFIRSFKHSSPELKFALDNAARSFHKQICEKLVPGTLAQNLHTAWVKAKDDTPEGKLVAFCDFLSVASYAVLERHAGNRHISEENTNLANYARNFLTPEFAFLGELPSQALGIVEERMP